MSKPIKIDTRNEEQIKRENLILLKKQAIAEKVPQKTYVVTKADVERAGNTQLLLLDFLISSITGKSRNNIKTLLTKGAIMVGDRTTSRHNYFLKEGDAVTVGKFKEDDGCPFDIVFENDALIAINKPSGLLSVATDKESEKTAFNAMLRYVKLRDTSSKLYILHRLDKDTSGVLIFAKSKEEQELLQQNWNDNVLERGYTAVVFNKMQKLSGEIKSYLRETSSHVMYSSPNPNGGKLSITRYNTIKQNDNFALLEVFIDSGRKNQIRVHMSDINHPVVGDIKYGKGASTLRRLALHSHVIKIKHPTSKEIITIKAPVPTSFAKLI